MYVFFFKQKTGDEVRIVDGSSDVCSSDLSGDRPSAGLGMRIVPAGVEPMIALASQDARVGNRSTHAEDLAVQVRDNALMRDRLGNEDRKSAVECKRVSI